ncbi:unnamed protein product [Phytomonas sp. Hart1]|nr:unnamed protein product [Phytomonas sp. Hart1]|eukprot:CCW66921.1 unnamed protein product [Phytomonas sp. isolate Hart1]
MVRSLVGVGCRARMGAATSTLTPCCVHSTFSPGISHTTLLPPQDLNQSNGEFFTLIDLMENNSEDNEEISTSFSISTPDDIQSGKTAKAGNIDISISSTSKTGVESTISNSNCMDDVEALHAKLNTSQPSTEKYPSTGFTPTPGDNRKKGFQRFDIDNFVRDVVLSPLQSENSDPHRKQKPDTPSGFHNTSEKKTKVTALPVPKTVPDFSIYSVSITDRFGMPADLPKGSPLSLEQLLEMSTGILREQLKDWIQQKDWRTLSPVQQAAIPLILELRDLLCIAPTATGKTFSYVFPTMIRLLMDDMTGRRARSPSFSLHNEEGVASDLNRRDIEALLQEKIDKGEVCRYCELSVRESSLCPMTGLPHPPPVGNADTPLNVKPQRPSRLEEIRSVGEPKVLVLVPTSQLAFQVYGVFRNFHCNYNIRYMVRASNEGEQKKYLHALEGVDVLISSPETILPALYKQKLSLRCVKTLVLDEVSDIVSLNHFEPLKIILGALPKCQDRPQRLLFGATLPPVAFQMLRERMLWPSHRFILAEPRSDPRGLAIQPEIRGSPRFLLGAPAPVKHLVFLLGRVEKLAKVGWLYQSGHLSSDQRVLIFCNSRQNVGVVEDHLRRSVPGLHPTTLTSRASAGVREGVLRQFASGVSTCLICTDLLSRGVDFRGVVYVVQYDMPSDMETWVHRNGRCGRHGLPGYVYTFFQPENIRLAKPLVAFLRQQEQIIPPKLQEYARQSFVDLFKNSLFHHPTRPYRRDDPQNTTPVLSRGSPRFPDYRQQNMQRHFRPL